VKSGILAAWIAGLGITGWRVVHVEHRIPAPGVMLGITGLFVAGALVSEWVPKSEPLVLAVLVGLDVAALMNVLPQGLGKQVTAAETAQQSALAPKAGESGSAAGEGSGGPLTA
jgi:hypothetical protein